MLLWLLPLDGIDGIDGARLFLGADGVARAVREHESWARNLAPRGGARVPRHRSALHGCLRLEARVGCPARRAKVAG